MAEVWECNYTKSTGYIIPPSQSSIVAYSRVQNGFYDDFDGFVHSIIGEDDKELLLSVKSNDDASWVMTNYINKETGNIKEAMISSIGILSKEGKCRLIK